MRSIFLAAVMLVLGGQWLGAQQLEIAHNHHFNTYWVNPAAIANDPLSRISLLHQHRNLAQLGWGSMSQFLDFKSKPLGRKRAFGFGANISNDIKHTERRLSVGFGFGAKLVQNELFDIGVGISAGMINWGATYEDIPVYQQGDPLISRRTNFSEVDAGLGLNFAMRSYVFRAGFEAFVKQLPGSFLSENPINGAVLVPHTYMAGKFLMAIGPDMYLGPWLFYRNTFSSLDSIGGMQGGQIDAGAKFELDRPRMWAGAAYRFGSHPELGFGSTAVVANFGIEIKSADTTDSQEQIASFIDLIFSTSYPLNQRSIFGPTAEIGLSLAIGKVGSNDPGVDTIGLMKGAFWVNNGNMDTHKERYLKANAPSGLYAESLVGDERVYLSYEWDDNLYLYAGVNMRKAGDTLLSALGDDWIGTDAIIENLVNEVISEALHPTHMDVENPDSVEPLKGLLSVQVMTRLRVDQLGADFGAEGVVYNGELGFNNEKGDSLIMPILYDGRDTIVSVKMGEEITNLELTCLKITAMSRKLEYELNKYYGNKLAFVKSAEEIAGIEDKKVVLIKTPEVIPNNPNQKPFQVSVVNLGFQRDTEWEPTVTTRKSKKKQNVNDAKTKTDRNNYRDPVGTEDKEASGE